MPRDGFNVLYFRGRYRFLSNFYPCQVTGPAGLTYPAVEHAYQASKCVERGALTIFNSPICTAADARRFIRREKIRPDWENVRVEVMRGLLRQKFRYRSKLGIMLSSIVGHIQEGNNWNDQFWGVDDRNGGMNMLGKLLMEIRDEHRYLDGEASVSYMPGLSDSSPGG